MSEETSPEPFAPGDLERARLTAGLSARELWFRYLALGGVLAPTDLEDWLRGDISPDVREYSILATALNEQLSDMGLNHPVRYLV